MPEPSRRILLVEDSALIARQWIRAFVRQGVECIHATTLREAAEHIGRWKQSPFDYALVDLKLPDGDGATLLPLMRSLEPRPAVAVISGYLDSARSIDLHGLCTIMLPKPAEPHTLTGVIGILESSRQTGPLVDRFAEHYRLSQRERTVLFAALRGLNNQEMADALECDRGTIATYWNRIFNKTGLRSQRDVIAELFRYTFGDTVPPGGGAGSGKIPGR